MPNSCHNGESWLIDCFDGAFPFRDEHLSPTSGGDDDHPIGHLEDAEDPLAWIVSGV